MLAAENGLLATNPQFLGIQAKLIYHFDYCLTRHPTNVHILQFSRANLSRLQCTYCVTAMHSRMMATLVQLIVLF